MKIELKSIVLNKRASQDSDCFTAKVYLDGKPAGQVRNEGYGGPHLYEPVELGLRLQAHAKTLPPVDISHLFKDGQKRFLPQSADLLISNLVVDHVKAKQAKKRGGGQSNG